MSAPVDIHGARRLAIGMVESVLSGLASGPPNPRGAHRRDVLTKWYRDRCVDVLFVISPKVHPWVELAGLDADCLREALRRRGALADPWAMLPATDRADLGGRPSIHDDPVRDRELVGVLRRLEG